ncbi:MAG TPA: TRAP transporter small permease [Xanthobacteraceae bacterium]|jgi:TRAP-type C4-dicarboxylate transport system permease small subunit
MLHAYDRLRVWVEAATWTLTGLLVVLVSANVFARYALGLGILWAEELSRLVFVWVVFLGSYVALCRKSHMAIEIVLQKVPGPAQRPLLQLSRVMVLIFLATVVYAGGQLVAQTVGFGRQSPILGISAAWGYLSVPVAALLMFLEVTRELVSGNLPPLSEIEGLAPNDPPPETKAAA